MRAFAVLTAGVVALAGCGGARETMQPPPSVASRCGDGHGLTAVWFRAADGTLLSGAVGGQGATGVVLAPGYTPTVCEWGPYADVLMRRGYRVLTFENRALGLSKWPEDDRAVFHYASDVAGAVAELRKRGSPTVLVDSSFGGTVVLGGAARVQPAVAGVVTLGGPPSLKREFNGARDLDGYAGVRRLESPLLLLTSRDDGHARVPDERRLLRLASTRRKRLVVYPGFAHATALLYEAPFRDRVSDTLLRFLASGAR